MSPERRTQLKALFGESLELPAAERSAFLASACDDGDLIAEVQSLLDAHEQPGKFMDCASQELRAAAFAASSAAGSRIGERIGAYRIVGVLGTGGMGDVFEAVRDDDQYHAQVAIKLMRADVRSSFTEQRFRSERQILARLDHRNIARLFDGGTTDTGMPYVVMERVVGEPIDRYCTTRDLTVRDRVQIFLQVCAAVSYAHQHLIVHRDLKPNNILVTPDGSAKLLDFGIAKLLEADAETAEANETATTMRAMTLEYASPEQVSGGAVTTVSDVYSLGVVLYRLLTGQSPYGARTTDAQRVAEILSDTSPARPSQVQRRIDGDLDNILLMALRKEPQHRYGSVEQLANDLRNYLAGMPVVARGNSLRYRTVKLIRRRKVEIAAGLLVACTLFGALFFSMREARIAEQQRQVAQHHFDSVRKLANTLLFELHDEIAPLSGSTKAREILVKTSQEYLNTLYEESGSDRALQEELAVAYRKVGDIQGNETGANTGDPKAALQSYARSVALLEPLVAADPENHRAGIVLGKAYLQQGRLLLATSGSAAALPVVERSVALNELLSEAFTDDHGRLVQLGDSYSALAEVLTSLGRSREAMVALDKLIGTSEAYARANPDDVRSYVSLNAAYNNAALMFDDSMPRDEAHRRAVALLRKAIAADEKLIALEPDNAKRHLSLAETRFNLGDGLYHTAQYAEAIAVFRQAAAVMRTVIDRNDARGEWMRTMVHLGLAKSLVKVGGYDEAGILFADAEQYLLAREKSADTLHIQFALAIAGIRGGEMYGALAGTPKLSVAEQLAYWRKARESLARGIARLKKLSESIALVGPEKEMMDDGAAALARAEAAIAELR